MKLKISVVYIVFLSLINCVNASNRIKALVFLLSSKAYVKVNWQASGVLADNSSQEPLITEVDSNKGESFAQRAEASKKRKADQYLSGWQLEFARDNPWYEQVLDELNDPSSSYSQSFPLPQDSILALFRRIKRDENDQQKALRRAHLFGQSAKYIDSKDTLQEMFKEINGKHRSFSFSNDAVTNYSMSKVIIQALDEAASKLELLEELKEAYDTLFSYHYVDWLGHGSKIGRDVIVDSIRESFSRYAELARVEAKEKLLRFLDHDIEWSLKIDKPFLRLLGLLSNEELNVYAAKLVNPDRLKYFVEALGENTVEAESLRGTALDQDAIAKKLLSSGLDKTNIEALTALFKNSNTRLYKQHEKDIIAILPEFAKKASHEYEILISMMTQRDCPQLQACARKTFIENTAENSDFYWQSYMLKDPFKNTIFFDDTARRSLYEAMNTVYQEKKSIKALQLLWMYLKDVPEYQDFLQRSVKEYFGLATDTPATTDSFSVFLDKVFFDNLDRGISQEQLLDVLKVARETKLVTLISPKLLACAKDWVIFNEQASFQERATCLDQRLLSISSDAELAEFYKTLDTRIINPDLKAYAFYILTTLRTDSASFDIFEAKKRLQEMHERYSLKGSVPEIVWNTSQDLPNFGYYRFCPERERPTNRIPLSDRFEQPHLDQDGLMYGFNFNNMEYSLWAIDGKTLDAVWQVPVKNYEYALGKEPKFLVHGETVYLVDGTAIRSFNRKNGTEMRSYSLQNELPVTSLKADSTGLLYVAHGKDNYSDTTVIAIHPQTGDNTVVESEVGSGGKYYFTVGEAFGYYYAPHKTITLLHPQDGSKRVIKVCTDKEEECLFDSHLEIKGSQIIFAKYLGKDDYHLVLYDTLAHSEKWSLPLPEGIRRKPCISNDGNRIYIINKKVNKITAIENNEINPNPIWTFEIPGDRQFSSCRVDELAISPDGNILYALSVYGGELYAINTQSGTLISSDKCEEGHSRHLAGVSPEGLPYIHTLSK